MALGIIPARGDWEYRRVSGITTLSQGAFSGGDLVNLDHGRNLSVWTSTQSSYLGVAMGSSVNSLPVNNVLVAIPRPGCTAFVDSLTTDAASNFSLGQSGSIITRYGRTSCLSMLPAGGSVFSFQVTIVGPMDSNLSRIEVAFLQQTAIYYSASSATLNN